MKTCLTKMTRTINRITSTNYNSSLLINNQVYQRFTSTPMTLWSFVFIDTLGIACPYVTRILQNNVIQSDKFC